MIGLYKSKSSGMMLFKSTFGVQMTTMSMTVEMKGIGGWKGKKSGEECRVWNDDE